MRGMPPDKRYSKSARAGKFLFSGAKQEFTDYSLQFSVFSGALLCNALGIAKLFIDNNTFNYFTRAHSKIWDSQHMNRHTYATRRIESGAELIVLKNELGHANINITADTYCDVFEDVQRHKLATGEEYLKEKGLDFKRKA